MEKHGGCSLGCRGSSLGMLPQITENQMDKITWTDGNKLELGLGFHWPKPVFGLQSRVYSALGTSVQDS